MKIDIQFVRAVGSDSLFDEFLHMLCTKLGEIDENSWSKQNVYDSLELQREFYSNYNSLRFGAFVSFRVPISLLDENTRPLERRGSIYFTGEDKLRIERKSSEKFLDKFNFIIEWLSRELQANTKRQIQNIIVAGELSDNPSFQNKISSAFHGRLVFFPVENDTIVLRGAVALGHIKSCKYIIKIAR